MKRIRLFSIAGVTVKRFALASAASVVMVVGGAQAATTTSTYSLGPQGGGTTILPGTGGLLPWIVKGAQPPGSILRSFSVQARLDAVAVGSDSYASDLCAYVDPTPEAPGTAALLQVGGFDMIGTVVTKLAWDNGDGGPGTTVTGTKTAGVDWTGEIDLNTVELSLGNGYSEGTWSGTITVEYDLPEPATIYSFTFPGLGGARIDQGARTIAITVRNGTDVTALAPAYTLSTGTCDKDNGGPTPYDFTNPVVYTVTDTGTDPDTVNPYTVTVTIAPPFDMTDGLALWLDASQLAGLSDGQQVNTWTDMSGMANNALRQGGSSAGYPQYVASGINGQPVVRFASGNGNTGDYFRFNRITTIRSVFWVVKENPGTSDGHFLLGDQDSYHFHRPSANGALWDATNGWSSENIRNGTTKLMGVPVDGTTTPLPAGEFQLISLVTTGDVQANQVTQDRVYHGSWQGDIAEILIYTKALTTEEEAEVGSFLATKYGLETEYLPLGPPAAPTGLAASPLRHAVLLNWTESLGAKDYNVYRGTTSGVYDPNPIGTSGGATTYSDTDGALVDGTPYYYVVAGTNSSGEGLPSDEASAAPSAVAVAQTITFGALPAMTFGDAPFDLAATASSGLTVSYASSDPLVASVSGSTVTILKAGTTTITASQAGDGDFTAATPVDRMLTVDKAGQTIVFTLGPSLVKQSNAPPFDDSATGGGSGNPVTYSSTNEAVASVDSSGVVTIIGEGETQILANQLGDADHYNAAPEVSQPLKVIPPLDLPVADGLVCWYDASEGVTEAGGVIQTWNDQSGQGHHATRLSGSPALVPNDINSRAAVHFRSTDGILDCAGAMFVKEQYVVVRSPNPNWTGSLSFLGRKSNDFLSVRSSSYNLANGTTGFWQDHYPITVVKNGYAPAPYPSVVNSNVNQDKNGSFSNGCSFAIDDITEYMILRIVVDDTASAENRATYPYYQIGRNETLSSGEFDLAEIIGFDRTLSAEEENLVGVYLSNKYNLSTAYVPAGGYADWIASKGLAGPDALPGADPDHDGLDNALEMVLGGEPNPAHPDWNSSGLLPLGSEDAGGNLVFTFERKDLSEGATTVTFQWSTDLSFPGANDVPVGAASSTTNGVTVDITEDSPDGGTDTIVITVPAAKAAGGKIFGRLSATVQSGGNTYVTWIASMGLAGPDALPGADPDHDGLANALEMVLGGEPNPANPGSDSSGLLPVGFEDAGGNFVFTFRRKDLSEGATTLTFQWSMDLSFPGANDVPVGATSSSTNGVTVDITEDSPDGDTDTIVITVPAAKAAGGMLFGRLSATVP